MNLIHWNTETIDRNESTCSHINIWKTFIYSLKGNKKPIKYIPICFKKNVKSINSVMHTSCFAKSKIINGIANKTNP